RSRRSRARGRRSGAGGCGRRDQARRRRAGLLPAAPRRAPGRGVRAAQAADDDRRLRAAGRWVRSERGRSAHHAYRPTVATAVARRDSAALERRARRHEPRRPPSHARVSGRAVHAAPAATARRKAGDHGLGADPRACAAALGRADRAGRLVRRAPLALARPQDPRAHARGPVRRHLQGRHGRLAAVIRFFSGADVREAVSRERALEAVREGFVAYARREWTMPPKVYVPAFPAGDFRAMPALGGGHALLKWVTSFPGNPAQGLPTVTGLVLLSD